MQYWIIWNKTVLKFNFVLPSRLGLQNTPTAPLQRGRPLCGRPGNDSKQSDGEAPVMQRLLGMQGTLSLTLFPGPLWPGMGALDSIYGLNRTTLHTYAIQKKKKSEFKPALRNWNFDLVSHMSVAERLHKWMDFAVSIYTYTKQNYLN